LTTINAAEMRGASMLRSGKNGTVRTLVPACSPRSQGVYQRYASGLYRQAFLTHGDSALAVHVVRDVIADECALPPAPECGEDDARHRLAAGCASVRGDDEDVTRAGTERSTTPMSYARPRAVNGTLMPG
jgi:hypothetical protein